MRSVVEAIVVHPLQNDEVPYIAALGTSTTPARTERDAAWDEIESLISESQRHAANSGLTSEQIDALLDAECAAVRYGRNE